MQTSPVTIEPDFRTALLAGLFMGIAMLVIIFFTILLGLYLYAPSISLATACQKLPFGRFLLFPLVVALIFPFIFRFCPRKSWTLQPGGIAIRS